jgi:glucose-6-phosphate isomerase
MSDLITYDYSFMMSDVVGETGATEAEVNSLKDALLNMRSEYFKSQTPLGFMRLPYDSETVSHIKELAQKYRSNFDTLLVLGIGGSDLGARAVISALRNVYHNWNSSARGSGNMRVFFLGSNTDPHEIEETLASIDLHRTAVNVISKSGDTVETMSAFILIRDLLIQAVGYDEHRKHIIATTDESKGTLRTIVDREGYDYLVVPSDVGGRFSVLSTVGLFPITCSGVDIDILLSGAQAICDQLVSFSETELHGAEIYAALHYQAYTKRKQYINVFIPYSQHLREFGFWFRQLWAESLGKKDQLGSNDPVYVGPTPIAALGATDQHSQFQLYYYGPFDKLITFVKVADFGSSLRVPAAYEDIEGISYMKNMKFADILNSELTASSLALAERKRPNGCITLPELTPFTVGQLFQFLEITTAYMGGLFNINAYDQPGVELGKQNMYALLKRQGYGSREAELQHLMSNMGKKIA